MSDLNNWYEKLKSGGMAKELISFDESVNTVASGKTAADVIAKKKEEKAAASGLAGIMGMVFNGE